MSQEEQNTRLTRKISILQAENQNLKAEVQILKQKFSTFENEQTLSLKKENLLLIQDYEKRLSQKIREIRKLRQTDSPKIQGQSDQNSLTITKQILNQKITHFEILVKNLEHDKGILLKRIKGLESRQQAILADKEASLTLLKEDNKAKIRELSMNLVILGEQNSGLKEKISELEKIIENFSQKKIEPGNGLNYRKLYIEEKKNYEELSKLLESAKSQFEEEIVENQNLKGVASRFGSVAMTNQVLWGKCDALMMKNFLLAVELERIGKYQ